MSMKDQHCAIEDAFKRMVSPMLVLLLLKDRPMYVYEIAQVLKERSNDQYMVSLALLYTVVRKLSAQGLVSEQPCKIIENRTRVYYQITDDGMSQLNQTMHAYNLMSAVVNQIQSSTTL